MRPIFSLFVSAIVFIFSSNCPGFFAQEVSPPSEEDNIRREIFELWKQVLEKREKSLKLYEEMALNSQKLRTEAEAQLESLHRKLLFARENSLINQKLLDKARQVEVKARQEFKLKNYPLTLALVQEAFGYIVEVPRVTLRLKNTILSPDGDGENDILELEPNVQTSQIIDSWQLQIWRSEPGEQDILVYESSGRELPQILTWDGKREDRIVVDSATNYYAQLFVKDGAEGLGQSNRAYFKTDIFVSRTERGLLINMTNIRFEPDRAELLSENYPVLQDLYKVLQKYPHYRIVVEGHAHFSGPATWSKTLSDKRAQAVADYLVSLGLERQRVIVQGMGEAMPRTFVAEEAMLNRRVAFLLMRTEKEIDEYRRFVRRLNFRKEIYPPKKK